MRCQAVAGLLMIWAAVTPWPAVAQPAPRRSRPAVSEFARPVAFPNANEANVRRHFNRARAIAGNDLYTFFDTLCIQDQLYKERTTGAQYDGLIPPQQVFDDLFYVGQMSVGAWALRTRAGIILFDTLDNADEAQHIIVPGLVALGLDPATIKYVVITHAHGDHYGGAQYLKDTYGAVLVASREDWEVMAKPPAAGSPFSAGPAKGASDIAVGTGDTIMLGGEMVHFVVTPGHTPGTLSSYFAVADHGRPHIVGAYGGIGMPRTPEAKRQQIASIGTWMTITKAARVDAQIGNHPLHFDGPARLEVLKYRMAGQPNPFAIGAATYQRYMDLQRECVKLQLARDGEVSD